MKVPNREDFSPHGWTLDTLEKYISGRLDEMEKRQNERERMHLERFAAAKESVNVAMTSAEKAITKAEQANEKRFDSVNEFRKALTDLVATYLPRTEYTVQQQALNEKIDIATTKLSSITSTNEGRARGVSVVGVVVLGCLTGLASITAVGAFVFAIINK